jgi:spore maturation protein CgeB
MTPSKIFLFDLPSQYGVLNLCLRELSEALRRRGVETQIFPPVRQDPIAFFNLVAEERPDYTLSFNGMLPDKNGVFLCDLIGIPHVAYLVDSPFHFFDLLKSPLTILACIDEDFCDLIKRYGFRNTFFLPHAASSIASPLQKPEWLYDVVMLNTFIDHEQIRKQWKREYQSELVSILDEAAELTLTNSKVSYVQAFLEVMNAQIKSGRSVDLKAVDFRLFNSLEAYLQGKSQIELLRGIEGVRVDIFGSHGVKNWKNYLGKKKGNIWVHNGVSFREALEIMKRSKILLNATPKFKRGLHERILNGMACGAAVLAYETPFLWQSFIEGEEVLLYSTPAQGGGLLPEKPQILPARTPYFARNWDELNDKIHHYLRDEDARLVLAENGRTKVQKEHNWDERAAKLISELSRCQIR